MKKVFGIVVIIVVFGLVMLVASFIQAVGVGEGIPIILILPLIGYIWWRVRKARKAKRESGAEHSEKAH